MLQKDKIFIEYRQELHDLLDYYSLPKVVAEIGVAEGWFTKEILKWDFDKLYLVDAWKHLDQIGDGGYDQKWHDGNYQQVLERVQPFGDKVTILRGLSGDMAKQVPNSCLGLIYIDADHSYEGVMNDLMAYYPKVVDGGIVSGHDFMNPNYGVNKAVKDFCLEMGFEIHLIPDEDESMSGFWFIKH